MVRLLSLSLHRAKNRSRDAARHFSGSDFHFSPNHMILEVILEAHSSAR